MRYTNGIYTSAFEKSGIDDLKEAILSDMRRDEVVMEFSFPVDDARSVARLYAAGKVMDKSAHDGRVTVTVRMEPEARDRLLKEGIEGLRIE